MLISNGQELLSYRVVVNGVVVVGEIYYRLWSRDSKIKLVEFLCTFALIVSSGAREEEEMSSTETSSLNIFPNPASSIIHFNFNNATNEDAVVSIYNLSGQLLKENKIQANEGFNSNEMNIEELSGGLYILRVTTQAKIMESKVMMTD